MPFINGKFYMNPAYGRALEAARARDETSGPADRQREDPGVHWVTIDGRHVLIQETQAGRVRYDKPRNKREAKLANIVYNETASLRADPGAKPGDDGSAEALHDAREGIAEIAKRAIDSGYPEYVAPPELSEKNSGAVSGGNPDAIRAYNDSPAAAREALAGADQTKGATQFRLRSPSVSRDRPINGKDTSFAYGPFRNTIGRPQTVVFAP
jgi:hypothetical protein